MLVKLLPQIGKTLFGKDITKLIGLVLVTATAQQSVAGFRQQL